MHHAIKQKRIIDIHSTPATKTFHTHPITLTVELHIQNSNVIQSQSHISKVELIQSMQHYLNMTHTGMHTFYFAPSLKTIRATLAPNNPNR